MRLRLVRLTDREYVSINRSEEVRLTDRECVSIDRSEEVRWSHRDMSVEEGGAACKCQRLRSFIFNLK